MRPASVIALILIALAAWGWNWRQASQTAPIVAHIEAGQKYFAAGRRSEAENEWRQAVKLAPDDVQAWQLLSDSYLSSRNWKDAQDALQNVQRLQPDAPNLNGNLAICAMALGETAKVEQYAEAELARSPNEVVAMEALIDVLAQRNELEKRTKYARRLVQLQPDKPNALLKLALVLDDQQLYQESLPLLNKLISLVPEVAAGYALRGKALFNLNKSQQDLKRAQSDLLKAVQLDNRDSASHWWLGKLYLHNRQAAKAILHFEMCGAMNPSANDYLFELARAYQQQGNTGKATALRRRYDQMEQLNGQISQLKSRLANRPEDFENNLQIGLLLLQSNNPLHVEKYLKKAQSLRPNDARAKSALQRLEAHYVQTLQAGLQALQRHQYSQVGPNLSRVLLLRPRDPRTIAAMQKATAILTSSKVAPR